MQVELEDRLDYNPFYTPHTPPISMAIATRVETAISTISHLNLRTLISLFKAT